MVLPRLVSIILLRSLRSVIETFQLSHHLIIWKTRVQDLTLTWEKQKFLLENQMIREASENMGSKLRRCNFITLFSLLSRF